MNTGLARVTISAPQRRVDVALPEYLPLVELLPEVLRHAGEGLADDGERHGGWVLRRADGAELAPGQALLPQGVRDGDLLHLVPARLYWPELEYDDVVEVIAGGARRRGAWSAPATRAATLAAAGLLLTVGLGALAVGETGRWAAGTAGGTGALLLLAAVTASRAYGDGWAGAVLGGFALPYAFLGGCLLVASADRSGVFGPARWIGAPEMLAGAAAVLLAAVLGLTGVGAGGRVFVAGALTGLLGSGAALVGFSLPAAGAAAILMVVLVCGTGALPLLAIRLGRLPMPPISLPEPAGAGGPAGAAVTGSRDRPDRARVLAAVGRTEEILTGLLTGQAALVVVAATVLAAAGGPAALVLTGVASASLLLRSRFFATVRQRVPLLVAGLAAAAVTATALVGRDGGPVLLGSVAAAAVLALLTVAAGAGYAHRQPGPYLGRAADVLDICAMVALVPVACAVLDLYGRARGLVG
jgi:type VII secretion integral membrane protein EccD